MAFDLNFFFFKFRFFSSVLDTRTDNFLFRESETTPFPGIKKNMKKRNIPFRGFLHSTGYIELQGSFYIIFQGYPGHVYLTLTVTQYCSFHLDFCKYLRKYFKNFKIFAREKWGTDDRVMFIF